MTREEGLVVVPVEPISDVPADNATRMFVRRVNDIFAVQETILFGSRARRTHADDSDADIAVILDGERGDRTAVALDMAAIAFEVMLETGILVDALPLWAEEFANPETFTNPRLIHCIRREGLTLSEPA